MPYQLSMSGKMFRLHTAPWLYVKHRLFSSITGYLTDFFFLAKAALDKMFTMADIQGGARFSSTQHTPPLQEHESSVNLCTFFKGLILHEVALLGCGCSLALLL